MPVLYDSAPNRRPLSFAVHVGPALLYIGAIFYGGLIRMRALPEVGFVPTDKLLHAAAFAGLAFLLLRAAVFGMPRAAARRQLSFAALGASAVGALLEICQAFVPYRSADVLDWVADTVGAGLAIGVLTVWQRHLAKQAND
ncbi:MAG TPA: VanZ family protein [Polyangiaceae bacterium]